MEANTVLAKLDRWIDCEKVRHGAVEKDGRLDGPSMLNGRSLFSQVHTCAYSGGFKSIESFRGPETEGGRR
jgi:phosphoribosylformimino-5-aminoimidazole carboxamide ribonucleotide (ProFAR) isomerase